MKDGRHVQSVQLVCLRASRGAQNVRRANLDATQQQVAKSAAPLAPTALSLMVPLAGMRVKHAPLEHLEVERATVSNVHLEDSVMAKYLTASTARWDIANRWRENQNAKHVVLDS